jgi:hypothetical protein
MYIRIGGIKNSGGGLKPQTSGKSTVLDSSQCLTEWLARSNLPRQDSWSASRTGGHVWSCSSIRTASPRPITLPVRSLARADLFKTIRRYLAAPVPLILDAILKAVPGFSGRERRMRDDLTLAVARSRNCLRLAVSRNLPARDRCPVPRRLLPATGQWGVVPAVGKTLSITSTES